MTLRGLGILAFETGEAVALENHLCRYPSRLRPRLPPIDHVGVPGEALVGFALPILASPAEVVLAGHQAATLVLALLLSLPPGVDRQPGRPLERHPPPSIHGRKVAHLDRPPDHPDPAPLHQSAHHRLPLIELALGLRVDASLVRSGEPLIEEGGGRDVQPGRELGDRRVEEIGEAGTRSV